VLFPGLPIIGLLFKNADEMMRVAAKVKQNGLNVEEYNSIQVKMVQYFLLFIVCAPISLIVMPFAVTVLIIKSKKRVK
jgi:hypothetical protein